MLNCRTSGLVQLLSARPMSTQDPEKKKPRYRKDSLTLHLTKRPTIYLYSTTVQSQNPVCAHPEIRTRQHLQCRKSLSQSPTSKIHTLATTTISHHNTASSILDADELSLLRVFYANPSTTNKEMLLTKHDILDWPGQRPGEKAATQSESLVMMLIARLGTEKLRLSERRCRELREWF